MPTTNSDTQPAASREVLVAHDDPKVRQAIQAHLAASGYPVSTCAGGISVWEKITAIPPAMVIMEWDPPGFSGIELTQRIRASCNTPIQVLVVMPQSSEEEVVSAMDAGADDFLSKPIVPHELIARVKCGMNHLARIETAETLASKDPLTLADNRRMFDRDCLKHIQRARTEGVSLACLLIDIDFFKHINDAFGHLAGDRALQQTATAIRSQVRSDDRLYRYGGDEFCVLLPSLGAEAVVQRAEQIRAAVAGSTVTEGDRTFQLRCSIGVAVWRQDVIAPGQLVDLADEALLLAKQSGRDQVRRLDRLENVHLKPAPASPSATMTAEQLMTPPPVTLQRDTPLWRVADHLVKLRVDSLPVVDNNGQLAGVVSEQDLLQQTPQNGNWNRAVDSVMRTNFVCFEAEAPITQVWDFFRRVAFGRVVIVHEGRPIGTISRTMLLRWATNLSYCEHTPADPPPKDQFPANTHRIIATMIDDLTRLQDQLGPHETAQWPPAIICAATRLQEQSEQLLAQTRYADRGGAQTTLTGNPVELCH